MVPHAKYLHTAYIGLGSNLSSAAGDRAATVRAAMAAVGLKHGHHGQLEAASSLYETEPVGSPEELQGQPSFINAVVCLRSEDGPGALMEGLLTIEQGFGRVRGARNGPRTLDLDLLMMEDLVLCSEALSLPHARMHTRRFVLESMVELAPALPHPVLGQTMAELLAALPDAGEQARAGVRRLKEAVAC